MRSSGTRSQTRAISRPNRPRWLQRNMVFHGVCGGSRDASRSPLTDPTKLSDAMRALDATREPLSAAQKQRVRAFVREVYTAALASPISGAAAPRSAYSCPPPMPRQIQLTHERR